MNRPNQSLSFVADRDCHALLMRDLNELWCLPAAPGRESRMDHLIALIDELECPAPPLQVAS